MASRCSRLVTNHSRPGSRYLPDDPEHPMGDVGPPPIGSATVIARMTGTSPPRTTRSPTPRGNAARPLEGELLCRSIPHDNTMIDAPGQTKMRAPRVATRSPNRVVDIHRRCARV